MMRIFERLRTSLGLAPIQLPNVLNEIRERTFAVATVASDSPATEVMCCGHCSGNAEGHSSERSNAQ
jgi:hypothetical protein